ncbi:signal recognition particle receptor FtsY [Candidatus Phycosocius bacilliformis]|uniref:Signal recognition particle receptor FtsY n=1 Tax=Candidatus Phycosocius bacilliformis TaxID=1445552 RepID=A0A2P2E9Y1_9PROT|nr:signal recognition particle-docking protein FtsY [Candidatus Phycosocius bacilliformis]GBF57862.1 signal recognition particle receptor FtsY [Candidatus Phycosocius bacilliformis]
MFGWGKKKTQTQTDVSEAPLSGSVSAGADAGRPIACLIATAHDPARLEAEIGPLVEAAGARFTGVIATRTTYEAGAVRVTLLADPKADAELVFITARAGGLPLAGRLDGLADLAIEELAADGQVRQYFAIAAPAPEPEPQPADVLDKLVDGLQRSSARLAEGVAAVFTKAKLDQDTLDELEELLITADLGASAAARIRANLARDRFGKDISEEEIRQILAQEIADILHPFETSASPFETPPGASGPRVILFVGVNGSGKTTTIGKIAHNLAQAGHKVMLAAGDTFRAAAVDQLKVWGERAGVPVVARETGADAAGLAFDALTRAKAEGADVLLIDTAGRLQNKSELMNELAKVVRVIGKVDPDAPHETWLVLDATVGQNAISQTEAFRQAAGITGLVMTKLDGTAKGGVLVAVSEKHKLPIRFVGVGERAEDLQPFSATAFAHALVGLRNF